MGIRVIGSQGGDSQRFRVAASNHSGTDGEPALGGDVDTGELELDGADNGDESGASVAPGFVDTATLDGDGSGASAGASTGKRKYTKRTGVKYGRGRSASRSDTTQTTDDIASYLASGHLLVARLLKMPQFNLTDEESKKLAVATMRVTQCYDMGIGTEEQRAWINLAMVAGAIYIPKVFAGKQPASNVVQMQMQGHSPHPNPPRQPISPQQAAREAVPQWMQ